MKLPIHLLTLAAALLAGLSPVRAQLEQVAVSELEGPPETVDSLAYAYYRGEVMAGAGGGHFAPYYSMSNRHGVYTQPFDVLARASLIRPLSRATRFSYGFGIDALAGYTSRTGYDRYLADEGVWTENRQGPPAVWLQQLYAEVKYRGVFLSVGLKEYHSGILNEELSSGDVTFSGNTRPMPGFRVGFIDFQNIPFTNGWVQLQGEIGYNKPFENKYLQNHFNYYHGRINTGWWYNYKRWYFRTKPSQPFSVTVGLQAAAQCGGLLKTYSNGKVVDTETTKMDFVKLLRMFIPGGGEAYWLGNHIGSWDFKARYRFKNGDRLYGYFQWLWEDGSGIGKQNGFDGLWGLEYKKEGRGIVTGVVVEYLDFTNQSGSIHWDVDDEKETTLVDRATGCDSYYNNWKQNSYSLFGMSIGTPFMPSPIYNLDGNLAFACNRLRGFHIGVKGNVAREVDYRVLFSWRRGWGTYATPFLEPKDDTSMLVEFAYRPSKVPQLTVKGEAGFDAGTLLGNNFGAKVSVVWQGCINNLKSKKK